MNETPDETPDGTPPPDHRRVLTTGLGGPPPRRLVRGTGQLQPLVGRRLLAGVTLRGEDGSVVRRQFHGTVTEVADGVVVLRMDDGTQVLLPADPAGYERARPGTYRLASGDVVVDPDWLTTWDVAPGPPEDPATSR